MRQPGHAHAVGEEHVQVLEISLQVLQPLDRKQRPGDIGALGALGQQVFQLGLRGDGAQRPLGALCGVAQLRGVEARSFKRREPGLRRLQLGDAQERDVVRIRAVRLVVLAHRGLGYGGEDLQRHIAFLQPRQVDVAAGGALEQGAIPHEGVRVHVHDLQLAVDGLRLVAELRQRGVRQLGVAAFDDPRGEDEKRGEGEGQERPEAQCQSPGQCACGAAHSAETSKGTGPRGVYVPGTNQARACLNRTACPAIPNGRRSILSTTPTDGADAGRGPANSPSPRPTSRALSA